MWLQMCTAGVLETNTSRNGACGYIWRRCTSGPDAPVDCNNEAIARLPLRYHHRQFRCTTRASSCTESQRNAFHPSRCSGVRATRIIKKFKKNNNNLPPYCGTCSSSRGAESMCTAPLCSGKHARLPFPRQYKNGVGTHSVLQIRCGVLPPHPRFASAQLRARDAGGDGADGEGSVRPASLCPSLPATAVATDCGPHLHRSSPPPTRPAAET